MSVAARRQRLLDASYATFGEPARYVPPTGSPVEGISVRRSTDEDVPVEFGANSQAIVDRVVLRVRVAEVATLVRGGRIEILDALGDLVGAYLVSNRARKVRFDQEWRAEVEAVT